MPAVAYQKAVAMVPARIDVVRGCQLSKASAKSRKTAARFLSVMENLNTNTCIFPKNWHLMV